jgi:hypothetical protein
MPYKCRVSHLFAQSVDRDEDISDEKNSLQRRSRIPSPIGNKASREVISESMQKEIEKCEADILLRLPYDFYVNFDSIISDLVPSVAFGIMIVYVLLLVPSFNFIVQTLGPRYLAYYMWILPLQFCVPAVGYWLWENDVLEISYIDDLLRNFVFNRKKLAIETLRENEERLEAMISRGEAESELSMKVLASLRLVSKINVQSLYEQILTYKIKRRTPAAMQRVSLDGSFGFSSAASALVPAATANTPDSTASQPSPDTSITDALREIQPEEYWGESGLLSGDIEYATCEIDMEDNLEAAKFLLISNKRANATLAGDEELLEELVQFRTEFEAHTRNRERSGRISGDFSDASPEGAMGRDPGASMQSMSSDIDEMGSGNVWLGLQLRVVNGLSRLLGIRYDQNLTSTTSL